MRATPYSLDAYPNSKRWIVFMLSQSLGVPSNIIEQKSYCYAPHNPYQICRLLQYVNEMIERFLVDIVL